MRWQSARRATATVRRRGKPSPHARTATSALGHSLRGSTECEGLRSGVVRKRARNESSPRAQRLSGRLVPFVVRPVRLHAKTRGLSASVFILRADRGYECAHCDYLISWHRARRLRRRFRAAGRCRVRITLPTPSAAVPCGWCWRMICFSTRSSWHTRRVRG